LQNLSRAADTLGSNLDAAPLPEAGPIEIRQAAQAFNRMQGRIKRLVDERSRALAAVSHDLRTPLTRLRLRTELVDDPKLRDQMAADLESMTAMIDATLNYLRGLQDSEPARLIDINALLHSLAEDATVLGKEIRVEGQAKTAFNGHLSGLRRALQNLIDNAITYGQCANIRVDDGTDALRLIVEDDGPGIPPADLTRVTEPYYRPDGSRSSETGGVGLGLSIVKDVALIHGGELVLANRPQGGLSATLILPRSVK
jgi:signal transduction histidine kinase